MLLSGLNAYVGFQLWRNKKNSFEILNFRKPNANLCKKSLAFINPCILQVLQAEKEQQSLNDTITNNGKHYPEVQREVK